MKFGEKSLRVLGPKIWNRLPPHIKNAENLSAFKRLIKTWDGVSCKCNLFQKIWIHGIASDTAKIQVYICQVSYMYIVILLVGFD